MEIEEAVRAMRQARRLELRYDDRQRVVEVHAAGYSEAGDALMLVWQVRGGSRSARAGWKLLRLDAVHDVVRLEEASQAPRPGYAGANAAISHVVAEL